MPGFFEAIGLAKPQQQQQQQQQPQGQQQPSGQQQPPNGQLPNNQGQQPNGQPTPNNQIDGSNKTVDPLAAYASMWNNNPNQQQEVAPNFSLDNKVLDQVASGLNFTDGVPAELMQKAQGGDIQAIMELMNHSARNAYRMSLQHGSALTDKFVGMREDHFSKRVPGVVRDELTMGALNGSEGSTMSPTARKQLADIAKKFQAANPDASPQEVATAAKNYVADLYKAIHPDAAGSNESGGSRNQPAASFDWDKWADSQ